MSIRWNSNNNTEQKPKGQMFGRNSNKQWVHPPDGLVKGHVVYKVKFLGECEVDQAKGTEVVKEGIRKMKFNKQVKKSEGQKVPKVELSISVDGIEIFGVKTKQSMYKFPIHRISYCADDKSDKKMFSFIAKESDSEKHKCLVFDSEKCAEEITLTVGQAFDLAYRKFLETSGKDEDIKKQLINMQKKVNEMHEENIRLKARISDLERLKDRNDLEQYIKQHQLKSASDVSTTAENGNTPIKTAELITPTPRTVSVTSDQSQPRSASVTSQGPVFGRRLENLLFEDDFTTTKSRSESTQSTDTPVILPPPVNPRSGSMRSGSITTSPDKQQHVQPSSQVDVFGSVPFNKPRTNSDAFGMPAFTTDPNQSTPNQNQPQQQKPDYSEAELMDLHSGFSRGLSFGTDDFSLDSLDPLKQK